MARPSSRYALLLLASRPPAGAGSARRMGGRFSVLARFPVVARFLPEPFDQDPLSPDGMAPGVAHALADEADEADE